MRAATRHLPSRPLALSLAVHAACVSLLCVFRVHAPLVLQTRVPGTSRGNTLLTYYSPGSLNTRSGEAPLQRVQSPRPTPPPAHPARQLPTPSLAAPSANQGLGATALSGLGQGDTRIALPSYHPDPVPSLATLQPGAAGDVVLDAVIDETGHIAKLTVLSSLGPAIDQSVIATVQQWLFTPATLDGKPVPSGQELHFHYQRRDTSA